LEHLSEWHGVDVNDRSTYPKVNAPVQVKYADGSLDFGYALDFFPSFKAAPESPITGWRYIKERPSGSSL